MMPQVIAVSIERTTRDAEACRPCPELAGDAGPAPHSWKLRHVLKVRDLEGDNARDS